MEYYNCTKCGKETILQTMCWDCREEAMRQRDRNRRARRRTLLAVGIVAAIMLAAILAIAAPINPRADVNGDGCVNAADLLAVRAPGNWGECVATPTPEPMRRLVAYTGTDPDACVFDVRQKGQLFAELDIQSSAHAIMAAGIWNPAGLTARDCSIMSIGYGIYSEADRLSILQCEINAKYRDPLRIAGGTGVLVEDTTFALPLADVAVRIHGSASDITFRRCMFNCYSWGVDIGEQYGGAGGCVRNVSFEDCIFIASPHTMHAVRIRGQNVRLIRCIGKGFDKAQPGATFATVEKHSCEPVGAKLIGCSVDGGKALLKSKWTDTEVK